MRRSPAACNGRSKPKALPSTSLHEAAMLSRPSCLFIRMSWCWTSPFRTRTDAPSTNALPPSLPFPSSSPAAVSRERTSTIFRSRRGRHFWSSRTPLTSCSRPFVLWSGRRREQMIDDRILIIDDDAETASFLQAAFSRAGVGSETVNDAFAAMERLREHAYSAVVLDPMIRYRLNGYAVLNFIELERPDMLDRLFLLTGMSEHTIRRTAPAVLPRLFRKPAAAGTIAAAVIAACGFSHDPPAPKASVLLVEDDLVTAGTTQRLLEELGFSVGWGLSGREALLAASERRFDVILLDLVMPDMDGFTVIEHFRDTRPGVLRRVIVTTGIPEQNAQALDHTSVGGVMHKPLDVQRLQELLRNCAANRLPFGSDSESA